MHSEEQPLAGLDLLGSPPLAGLLSRWWKRSPRPGSVEVLRERLGALAGQGAALDLRLARLLVWFSRQNLSELGYPSFTVFCRERVEWKSSWLRALRRLVQSPLDLVKMAASRGEITLRVAVEAPGRITAEQQAQWLTEKTGRDVSAASQVDESAHELSDVYVGEEAEDIRAARQRARVLIGKRSSNRTVDEYIIGAWQDDRPAAELLAEARTPPAPPDLTPGSWDVGPDPATDLVGPWVHPRDLHHGIALLDGLQAIRRGRIAALGLGLDHLALCHQYLDWGFDSLRDYGRRELGLSARTVQRHRKLGRALDLHEELLEAVLAGLDLAGLDLAGLDLDSAVSFGELAETGVGVPGRPDRLRGRAGVAVPGEGRGGSAVGGRGP